MSIAAIGSTVPVLPQAEVQKASTPVPPQSTPAPAQSTPIPADSVSISAAGHKSASVGDADHDGDSH
jgi:hypothetical protein